MGNDWIASTLGAISSGVSYGYTESASLKRIGPHFLRITDIQNGVVDWNTVPFCKITEDNKTKYLLEQGDIVVARTGNSTGENYIFTGLDETVFASYLIRFQIDKNKADPFYVWYNMRSPNWWSFVDSSKTGSAQAGANAKLLSLFPLKIPPIKQQKTIAHILRSLDDKIELNRQMNATLERMAQALFKSWFVDFDPVIDNALAAGNPIPEPLQTRAEIRKALGDQSKSAPEDLQKQFPDRFIPNAELGWMPGGWSVKPLKEFGQIVCGKTPSKSRPELFGQDIPFIKIPDMHSSVFVVESNEKLSLLGAASQTKKTIPRGSICVSCIATVGKVVITSTESQTNQQINSIVPKAENLTPYLYFYMLSLEKLFHDLASGGSATLNMNTSSFSRISVLNPDEYVLKIYGEVVSPLFSKIESNQNENITLVKLRDTLIPRLLSGELKVPEAESIIDKQLAEA